jgi:hypothetical protein
MKIIKEGKPKEKTVLGKGMDCGCEFECLLSELRTEPGIRPDRYQAVDCPTCGKGVWVSL